MLHIHNGDSCAMTARKASIPGEHLAWREALVCGPAPGNLAEEEFLRVRAEHLSEAYGVVFQRCLDELRRLHQQLAAFREQEEVVLWFEHDLFCQVQLIYLLNWFARHELGNTKLSLVCIDDLPAGQLFHGLGQLNEQQLSSLFSGRQEITPGQLALGAKAWQAYSSPEALKLLSLLESDTSPLPFLKDAFQKHLQRFPSTRNGLGKIENVALRLMSAGHQRFKSLFPAFMRTEPLYGFGDAQFYLALENLIKASTPAIRQNGDSAKDPLELLRASFEMTDLGKALLDGKEDFVIKNGIDTWLGGVRLQGTEAAWRWDEEAQELLVSW